VKSLAISIAITVAIIAASLVLVADKDTVHAPDAATAEMSLGTVESMVGGLEQRLQQDPDDGKGWLLLAKSYRHLGRVDDARIAYKKAEVLGSGDATVAAQLYGLDSAGASQ